MVEELRLSWRDFLGQSQRLTSEHCGEGGEVGRAKDVELHRNPGVSCWGLKGHSAAQKEEEKGLILSLAYTVVCLWDNLGHICLLYIL